MPPNPQPTKEEVRVATDAVRAEAVKWDGLGDDVGRVKTVVDNLTLNQSAFFVGDRATSQAASNAYNGLHTMMSTIVNEASVEFHEMAGALRRAADVYERTEGANVADLSAIYGD